MCFVLSCVVLYGTCNQRGLKSKHVTYMSSVCSELAIYSALMSPQICKQWRHRGGSSCHIKVSALVTLVSLIAEYQNTRIWTSLQWHNINTEILVNAFRHSRIIIWQNVYFLRPLIDGSTSSSEKKSTDRKYP